MSGSDTLSRQFVLLARVHLQCARLANGEISTCGFEPATTCLRRVIITDSLRIRLASSRDIRCRPRPCENANRMSLVRHLAAISDLRRTSAHCGPLLASTCHNRPTADIACARLVAQKTAAQADSKRCPPTSTSFNRDARLSGWSRRVINLRAIRGDLRKDVLPCGAALRTHPATRFESAAVPNMQLGCLSVPGPTASPPCAPPVRAETTRLRRLWTARAPSAWNLNLAPC